MWTGVQFCRKRHQDGKIARLSDDLTALAEAPHLLRPANAPHVGFEGANLVKIAGRYVLICAEFNRNADGRTTYDCMAASSSALGGPYGERYLAVPHGGHNLFFQDRDGHWWSTFFGNDPTAPFVERPALLRIEVGPDGKVRPKRD
jgi:xylan 1,4-beta-xylosidase